MHTELTLLEFTRVDLLAYVIEQAVTKRYGTVYIVTRLLSNSHAPGKGDCPFAMTLAMTPVTS